MAREMRMWLLMILACRPSPAIPGPEVTDPPRPDDDTDLPVDKDGDGATADEDCDDDNPLVFPGAWDICGDDLDNDCDGEPPSGCRYEGRYELERAHTRFYGQAGEYGISGIALGDLDDDAAADLVIGFSGDADLRGRIYFINGLTAGGPSDLGPEVPHVIGEGNDSVGRSRVLGDATGDGHADLVTVWRGGISILRGPFDEEVVSFEEREHARLPFHWLCPVRAVDDFDRDGKPDLIVGNIYDENPYSNRGAVYLFSAPTGSLESTDATVTFHGDDRLSTIGRDVADAGDVDGDGWTDVLVSADDLPQPHMAGKGEGIVFLLTEPAEVLWLRDDATATLRGTNYRERAGTNLARGGDVNGDGYADLIIGSNTGYYYADDGEPDQYVAASLVLGPFSGERSLGDADARYMADSPSDGAAAVALGDFDADGLHDVLVGALGARDDDGDYRGSVSLYYGFEPGVWTLRQADARFVGTSYAFTGWELAVGDVNADGFDDFAVMGPDHDRWVDTEPGAGAVWLVLGGGGIGP